MNKRLRRFIMTKQPVSATVFSNHYELRKKKPGLEKPGVLLYDYEKTVFSIATLQCKLQSLQDVLMLFFLQSSSHAGNGCR